LISQLQSSFSEQEVIHIANDLMIAAAVTTSYTTLWTIYLLGINPEEQNSKIPAKRQCISKSIKCLNIFPNPDLQIFVVL
jgi:cytochrome P450